MYAVMYVSQRRKLVQKMFMHRDYRSEQDRAHTLRKAAECAQLEERERTRHLGIVCTVRASCENF